MTPEELVAAASPKIRDLGWAYYFTPETVAAGEALGLDVFRFYFLGRGGVLGDVEPAVVSAAFGYFNPSLVAHMWTSGKERLDARAAAQAYWDCCAEHGRRHLADIPELDAFTAALDAVHAAADPVGLMLYAAARTQPLADDAPARAMQLVALLREHRGSAHLVAIRVAGLDDKTAHFIRRPGDIAMFGWSDADAPEITDAHRVRLDEAERITDDLVRPAFAVLDDAGQRALLDGLDALDAAIGHG